MLYASSPINFHDIIFNLLCQFKYRFVDGEKFRKLKKNSVIITRTHLTLCKNFNSVGIEMYLCVCVCVHDLKKNDDFSVNEK